MLIFVYNADSGSVNAVLDTAHKILSPSTYQCQLCQLSYGLVKENQAWKAFRESLHEEVVFLHRDEFEEQYAQKLEYPVLLRKSGDEFDVLLSAQQFNTASDTSTLIDTCKKMIAG